MYFANSDDRVEFKNKGGITNANKFLFEKIKIKAVIRDSANNVIEECEDYPRSDAFAYAKDISPIAQKSFFSIPLTVKALKKGKYILSVTINQEKLFDYSKVKIFEFEFHSIVFK